MALTYTIKAKEPKDIIAEIARQIELRKMCAERQALTVKFQKDKMRLNGEAFAYRGLLEMLNNIVIVSD